MEKIKMQPTRPEDALLTDAFADFLEKCRAKNLSEKTLNIYTVHFKFFKEYFSDPDKKASDITEDTLEGFIRLLPSSSAAGALPLPPCAACWVCMIRTPSPLH